MNFWSFMERLKVVILPSQKPHPENPVPAQQDTQRDFPEVLLCEGVEIGTFEKGGCQGPWLCCAVSGLRPQNRIWLEKTTEYIRLSFDLENEEDAVSEPILEKALQDRNLTHNDVERFDRKLFVRFASGDVFSIGPAYFDNGYLEWRNGAQV